MTQITLQGSPVNTSGALPKIGERAPDFLLTKTDLSDVSLQEYAGKRIVLNIFPSIDTSVCASSVRRFNVEINKLANAVCLCASRDLPFAHSRFCGAEGLDKVIAVSELRNSVLGDGYGVRIIDGPLAGLLARAVVVIDEKGQILHSQLVPEITEEPDYEAALKVLI
ncbi:MAG: thiol peroxidase [Desulfobulbaceae bacterium]